MIIALAGRRVDGAGARPARFPLANVELVRTRVRAFLMERGAIALVASAACGADLIALSEAGHLGLKRRVILPFSRERFRQKSVIDRPGDWGPLFDAILDEVQAATDLVILENASDHDAYSTANHAILDEAVNLAKTDNQPVIAVQVWEGSTRGGGDLTEEFGVEARKRGLQTAEILTI